MKRPVDVRPFFGKGRARCDAEGRLIELVDRLLMLASNDHAVLFRFTPLGVELTDITMIWLVDEDAEKGTHYDLGRLTWLWHTTTGQDKAIVEANACGIRSYRYQPGPVSLLEDDVRLFRQWYLAMIGPPEQLHSLVLDGRSRYIGL